MRFIMYLYSNVSGCSSRPLGVVSFLWSLVFYPNQGLDVSGGCWPCVFGVYLLSQRKTDTSGASGDGTDGVRISRTNSQDQERLDNKNGLGKPLLSSNTSVGFGGRSSSSSDYFEEVEIVVQDGHIGLGLYPDVVKIRHPKYSRVQ